MTEQDIYNEYGIQFKNTIFDSGRFEKKTVKEVQATNGSLYRFLNYWNNVSDIDNRLLPVVESVLNDIDEEAISDSDSEWAELDFKSTNIFYNRCCGKVKDIHCELPTEHFKTIIIGWRSFLMQPPFNGTRVKWYSNLYLVMLDQIRRLDKISKAHPSTRKINHYG